MYWVGVIGLVALLSLVLSVVLLVLQLRRRRKFGPLPDGDYVVTIIETRGTPQGVATVFRVDEPEEFKGHTVTIVKGKVGSGKSKS